MTDVFVKVWAGNEIRLGMAMAVIARCKLFDCRLRIIVAKSSMVMGSWDDLLVLPNEDFHIGSKALAEELAESDPYVVLDCDHLPIGKTWLEDGVRALKNHDDYACLSSWSINGEVPERNSNGWCWESECTGTPYFIRKGIIEPKRMPVGQLMSYDTTLSNFIRSKGKIGFLRQVRHNHLGYGFSQVIPGWWKA